MCTCNTYKPATHHTPALNEEQEFELILSELHDGEFEESVPENDQVIQPPAVRYKKVPFAPLPPEGSYWPLISKNKSMAVISYKSTSGVIGKSDRRFGAGRSSSGGRHHAGIDIYADHRDPVVAIEEGVILAHYPFCCGENKTTYNLLVKHSNVVVTYGEVAKDLPDGLKVKDKVRAGQIIAYVGKNPKGSSMLHFETYTPNTTTNHIWYVGKKAPASLYDPTLYLLHLLYFGKMPGGYALAKEQPDPTAPVIDLNRAVVKNKLYAKKLGWTKHYSAIQAFLGISSTSTEEDFARAVAKWQRTKRTSDKYVDGIIGPNTWKLMRGLMNLPADSGMTVIPKKKGYVVFGGGKIKPKLCELKRKGLLKASFNEIDTLLRVSNSESGKYLCAVNNWDDGAYLSLGFTQFTIGFNSLQGLIKKLPLIFKNHEIELESPEQTYPGTNVIKLKNTESLDDLRSKEWAIRFYNAGLEDEVIAEQVYHARERLNGLLRVSDPDNFLKKQFPDYNPPEFWAHIYESYNALPSLLYGPLRKVIAKAKATNLKDPIEYSRLLVEEFEPSIRAHFTTEYAKGQKHPKLKGKPAEQKAAVEKQVKRASSIRNKMYKDSGVAIDESTYCN